MTSQDAMRWCESQLNKHLDFDGAWGGQCVDFFNFYYQYITGRNPYSDGFGVPGACDLWDVRVDDFEYIANVVGDDSVYPREGDIVIWDGDTYGTGGNGHVAISTGLSNAHTIDVYEQNYGGQSVMHHSRGYNGHELGWMRFKGFNKGEDMIKQEDLYQVRVINSEVEGYPLTETHAGAFDSVEMAAWVGQPWPKLINQKWQQGQAYRSHKKACEEFYNTWKDKVAELSANPSKADLQAVQDALKAEQAKVAEAEAKLQEALSKPPVEKVVIKEVPPTNWILDLLKRIFK